MAPHAPLDAPFILSTSRVLVGAYRPQTVTLHSLAEAARSAPIRDKDPYKTSGWYLGECDPVAGLPADAARTRSAVVLDIEPSREGDAVPDDVPDRIARLPWHSLTYASPSYRPSSPRWRVIIPLQESVYAPCVSDLTAWVIHQLGDPRWVDPSCAQPARRFFAPTISSSNPDREAIREGGLPVHLREGRRFLAEGEVPHDFRPRVLPRSQRRIPRRGRLRKDPRTIKGVYGAFNRCFTLDDVIELSAQWPCGPLPYAHTTDTTWRWLGAAQDGAEGEGDASLSQINRAMPLYYDHAMSSPHGGTALCAFDLAASWMYGPLAARDGRQNVDAGHSDGVVLWKRSSTKKFAEFLVKESGLVPRLVEDAGFDDAPAQLPAEQDAGSGKGVGEAEEKEEEEEVIPPDSDRPEGLATWESLYVALREQGADVWTPSRIERALSPRDSKSLSRKLTNVSDQEILLAHDPVLRGAVVNARSGSLGWLRQLPGQRRHSTSDATYQQFGYYPTMETDLTLVRLHLSTHYSKESISADTARVLWQSALGQARKVDKFYEYLMSLPAWDGESRLGQWHPGVRDSEFDHLVMRKFVIALVARTLDPGCEMGWMPVFIGPPSTYKSSTLRWLVDGRYSEIFGLDEPHVMERIARRPLAIWDEFHLSSSERDPQVNLVKTMVTRTADSWHVNYARTPSYSPRMWVLAATANAFDVPPAMDGMRRFMPVHIESGGGPSLPDGRPQWRTDEWREQVLAEALAAARAGEPITMSDERAQSLQEEAVGEVQEDILEEEELARFVTRRLPLEWCEWSTSRREAYLRADDSGLPLPGFSGEVGLPEFFTPGVLIEDGLGLRARRIPQTTRISVARAMRSLGWRQSKRKVSRRRRRVWVRPAEAAADA